jgi:dihydrolipoamide dehydrogenase
MGAQLEDVAGTMLARPTLSEGMLEAALRTLGRPIHI